MGSGGMLRNSSIAIRPPPSFSGYFNSDLFDQSGFWKEGKENSGWSMVDCGWGGTRKRGDCETEEAGHSSN
jgi:hypothetical protein